MKVFIVELEVRPECVDDFIEVSRFNQSNSVKEAGNVRFDVLRDESEPMRFRLYEIWRDDEAIAAHRESAHYREWAEKIGDMLCAPRTKSVSVPVALTE